MPDLTASVDSCYEHESEQIVVRVLPRFLEDESTPENHRYIWAYTIAIKNMRDDAVKLMSRYWRITDQRGRVQEVRGDGVIGETPTIEPGHIFEYTSGAPLTEPSGIMEGEYSFVDAAGNDLTVAIPTFSLDSPYDRASPN